ncbi:hypothetical protein [Solimonas terrae]|uniref:Peptidase M50 domain-containing protein n=1 Tax=Solimonas terrae TaxID=1396819 RepID=A0A6M2BU89_9GAMM|nr:hypothetical protein [Solimonas terrae]NGY05683.1 hypothetical protein [Solimonas terrae]
MNADDSRMPVSLVLRDLLVIALSIFLWQWSHALHDAGAASAMAVAIVAGLLLPVSAYFVHEWGHLSGALASGSRVHFPRNAVAVFLFRFDVDQNDRRQFLAMSVGGYVASLVVVALLLATLQLRYLADQIALTLTAIGVLATFILELPPFYKVWRGAPLPHGAAFVSERD